jgi:hypothetical protein
LGLQTAHLTAQKIPLAVIPREAENPFRLNRKASEEFFAQRQRPERRYCAFYPHCKGDSQQRSYRVAADSGDIAANDGGGATRK